ncbi:MAG: hypothetical protein LKJ76_06740 [Lachnospiraceae bacterium]|jgi:HD-GYP domain-containing protein (c-di-GMP phosphodiesterase class II)|nr:hypothetical protein [Lachnospiraceae bacterium]
MMINELQRKRLQQQFDLLSAQVKGHCVRTGLIMQIFTEQIIISAPSIPAENKIHINNNELILCARELGIYHHLGDSVTPDKSKDPEENLRDLLQSVFKSSRNANGYFARSLLDTMESHEERWNGSGLPRNLHGDEIPFWGRVCAIAEAYDTSFFLCAEHSQKKAMRELSDRAGSDFDPDLMEIFQLCSKKLHMLDS